MHLAAGSRALIEQILGSAGAQGQSVLFEVSVLSVHAAAKGQ